MQAIVEVCDMLLAVVVGLLFGLDVVLVPSVEVADGRFGAAVFLLSGFCCHHSS